jgi:hypothetical protein
LTTEKKRKLKEEKNARGCFEKPTGSGVWWINYFVSGQRHRECVGTKQAAKSSMISTPPSTHPLGPGSGQSPGLADPSRTATIGTAFVSIPFIDGPKQNINVFFAPHDLKRPLGQPIFNSFSEMPDIRG